MNKTMNDSSVQSSASAFSLRKLLIVIGCIACVMAITCIPAFATDGEFTISASTVAPITSAINSGLTTLVPIGIGIMATFIGVHLIRRVIYMFL